MYKEDLALNNLHLFADQEVNQHQTCQKIKEAKQVQIEGQEFYFEFPFENFCCWLELMLSAPTYHRNFKSHTEIKVV